MAILKSFDGTLPELPEEVIQHILSLVPIKDGCRASCFSKTWLNAWRTRSNLYFDESFCYLNPRNSQRGGFLNYGNRALQRFRDQKIGIQSFKLHFRTPIVSEWIQVALKNGVKKLELVAGCSPFVVPRVIFEDKSPALELTVEGYGYSWLKLPKSMTECQHVKSLHLRCLHLDNSDLQRITSICPIIEDLIIWDCTGIGSFKVTNLSKLKQFEFRCKCVCDKTLEVEVPSLEVLYCSGFQLSMNASQNLKQLQLFEVRITDAFFLDFNYRFPHLENLMINSCQNLGRIRMSSPTLRKMELDIHPDDFLQELHIDAPNMTHFELSHWNHYLKELKINAPRMTSFKYIGTFIHKVSFTSSSSHCCSHIDLIHSSDYNFTDTEYFVYLKKFLKNFSQSKIYLSLDNTQGDYENFDVKKAMDMDTFDAVQVQELILSPYIPKKCLDGLFWSCHPKTIRLAHSWTEYSEAISDVSSHKCSELAEFTSENLMDTSNQEDEDGSSHIKFWNRGVKQIIFREQIRPFQDIPGQLIENILEFVMET